MVEDSLKSGGIWPYHYRGTKYHYNGEKDVWWQTFKDGLKVKAVSGFERILDEILLLKTEGGSFRITETGDVIAKVESPDGWPPKFICEMDEPFKFEEEINVTPEDIQPGDLWPAFYDGARYSYLMDKIWWHNPDGYRQYVKESLPKEVIKELRRFKPEGGSFRITENGYVISLIPKQPLPKNIKKQWEILSDIQQRLIAVKVERTDKLPIYIGRFYEGITLNEPENFSKPLTKEERVKMLEFLDGFSYSPRFEGMVPKGSGNETVGDDFRDDPEDEQ